VSTAFGRRRAHLRSTLPTPIVVGLDSRIGEFVRQSIHGLPFRSRFYVIGHGSRRYYPKVQVNLSAEPARPDLVHDSVRRRLPSLLEHRSSSVALHLF
jgi:hypothetical protein